MDFRAIRQTSHIDGVNRNPGADEHDKSLVWDNVTEKFKYVSFTASLANSKTNAGYVAKGDDAAAENYVWKLDGTKNPSWRKEDFLVSVVKTGNDVVFTMNDSAAKTINFGALAFEDSTPSPVDSVFGRLGAVIAQSGDYTAAQVTNAFNKLIDTLDDVTEGSTNKHFTETYRTQLIEAYAAMHTHANKSILDLITDAGGGVIPTAEQISEWDTYSEADAENVRDTVATFIQDNTGITWTHDDDANTLTPEIHLDDFTTDDLPEGSVNKYGRINVYTIEVPTGDVSERAAGAVGGDGTDGWTYSVAANPNDFEITHNLGRKFAYVTVSYIDDNEQVLLMGNLGYTGISAPSDDVLVIKGLSTKAFPLTVNLIFA